MAWNTELEPIEYLLKREAYYIKSAKWYRKMKNNEADLEHYRSMSDKFTSENMALCESNCMNKAARFRKAAEILSQNM